MGPTFSCERDLPVVGCVSQAGTPQYVLKSVVWNFPHATSMYIANVGFRGTILAPHAGKQCRCMLADLHGFCSIVAQLGSEVPPPPFVSKAVPAGY